MVCRRLGLGDFAGIVVSVEMRRYSDIEIVPKPGNEVWLGGRLIA